MGLKEEEKSNVNSSDVKYLEKILDKVEIEEQKLIDEFDLNVEKILGKDFVDVLLSNVKGDIQVGSRIIRTSKGKVEASYSGILTSIHKSMIDDPKIRLEYEKRLKSWFSEKALSLRKIMDHQNDFEEINRFLPFSYALASLALTTFHGESNMHLRDVQKLAGIAIANGDIAELGTGEGKTLAGVLPTFLHALRGKGVHVITANSYLSKRDYEELRLVFEGLGLSVGFIPESVNDLARIDGLSYENLSYDKKVELNKKLALIKKKAYNADITYGSKSAIAFDYLRDSTAMEVEDFLQREENPGFALIDEIDDVLIDDAQCPYVLGGSLPIYTNNMTLLDLANVLNVPYDEIRQKISSAGISVDEKEKLSYEKARNISVGLYSKEIIPDQYSYQKIAQRFFEMQVLPKIYVVKEPNEFGINPEKLYENLTRDEKEYYFSKREKEIVDNSSIIYYPDRKKFHVFNSCYENFLTYCYFSFQINSVLRNNEKKILEDTNYVVGRDYNIVNGTIFLTGSGANKIVSDSNHPEFMEDYNSYMSLVNPFASDLLHYFDQALTANLLLSSPLDYVVDNDGIKVVKNGRIQDGSTFTEGLHQALEFKEHISESSMTRENHTIASITQKDFYGRYDAFSGMTGTSSKRTFREIFGKNTVSVPRDAFYEFYSNRVKKKKKNCSVEPLGVEKKEPIFALNKNDKINLIVESIKKSHSNPYPQPVLLVVSNPEEMNSLSNALSTAGIKHSLLNASTDKSKEAEIIAKAGLIGAVTISTEMAGRGTDIKLGGDRNTIINIATERHIKRIEEKIKHPISLSSPEMVELRKKVEESLMSYTTPTGGKFLWSKKDEERARENLSSSGLKVISSGYFKIDRIDRQLEGRTGRNGLPGLCERFVCPSDLEYIGVKSLEYGSTITDSFREFSRSENGALEINKKFLSKINEKVKAVQSSNEEAISESIRSTQYLSKTATKVVEKCRDDRRNILFGNVDLDLRIQSMLEDTVDNLIMSYVVDGITNKESLLRDLSSGFLDIDMNTLALEAKEVLGINIDVASVLNSDANFLEFRNALLEYTNSYYYKLKENNPNFQEKKSLNALLTFNDYIISNIPNVLTGSITQKSLAGMSFGLEDQADYYANKEFYRGYLSTKLEASKIAIKQLMGTPLSLEERNLLDQRKNALFGLKQIPGEKNDMYEFQDSDNFENDGEKVQNFRMLKKPLEEEAVKEFEKADSKALSALQKGETSDLSKFYTNLRIRPMKFIESLTDTSFRLVPVRVQPILENETYRRKV